MTRGTAIAAAVLVLAACAQTRPPPEPQGALLDALLPPSSLGRQLSLSQRVEGEFDGRARSLRVEVEATPERLTMVALSLIGTPLFSLEQKSADVTVESFGPNPLPFDPRYILADFQLAHWPAAILGAKYESLGLHLREDPASRSRLVFDAGGNLLAQVTFVSRTNDSSDILIVHFDFPYRLKIKSRIIRQASRGFL